MGVTVRQKAKGKGEPWWIFIHHNRTIKSKQIGDRRAAETLASELRKRLKAGELNVPESYARESIPMFAAYAGKHIENYAKLACKYTTWKNYEAILKNHLSEFFKDRRLDEVTRADVKRLILQKQQEGYAPATVQNIRNLVSGIFTHAYEDEILNYNPALKLGRYIKKDDRRSHVKPLTREQAAQFLLLAKEHYPRHYPFLLCAFRTGMRSGELVGLAWSDIDFDANTITVQRSYSHGRFSTPKSRRFRIVDLSDQLKQTLLGHCVQLREAFRGRLPTCDVSDKRGTKATVELVFPSKAGGVGDEANFRHRVFYEILEEANVPRIRFHDIRHTFASLLLTQGESLHYVKEQMGHASIQTTVDIYGHLVPGTNRRAVNRLDDLGEPVPNTPATGVPDLRLVNSEQTIAKEVSGVA